MGLVAAFTARRGTFEVRVELDVADGETLALLGPNGAGKSTVVDTLIGTLELTSGTIEIDGERVDRRPPEERPIGVCFQDDLLFPRLSALENVAFPLRARGVAKADARGRAVGLLTDLAPSVDPAARPDELSGGERQRVALARALAPEPRLLLLDEPFSNVDVSARPGLRALVREVAASFGGATVLIAHEPLDALTLADRITLLEEGRVTQSGPAEEIRSAPRSKYAADLIGVNLFDGTLEPLGDGAARLHGADGDLIVAPDRPVYEGARALASIRPIDVSLHAREPEGSARNAMRGPVLEVASDGDRARVWVRLAPAAHGRGHRGLRRAHGPAAGRRRVGQLQGRGGVVADRGRARGRRWLRSATRYPWSVKTTERESLEPSEPTSADPGTPKKHRNPVVQFLGELPGLIIMAFVLALVIKTFLVQAFYIPSGSMEPTLVPGDRVLVMKVPYCFHDPAEATSSSSRIRSERRADRGLVSGVFHWMFEGLGMQRPDSEDFIKRVIGKPGDIVMAREGWST